MKHFAFIGVAGYVAPRHLKAIKETNNTLVAAFDPHDSVGILDSYFPQSEFFTNFERFERHIFKQNSDSLNKLDYLTICSPNYLHDTHIRVGLLNNMDVICEKPLVLNPHNLDLLEELEYKTSKKIFTVMQLRYHQSILDIKNNITCQHDKRFNVNLKYITPRGNWYFRSWKGEVEKSGGIATNIGIHLFDLLIWLFGKVEDYKVELLRHDKMSGMLKLERADIKWFLSIDRNDLPKEVISANKSSYRSMNVNGEEIEFSEGFSNLHTKVYEEILAGNGLGIKDARPSIELVYQLRNTIVK